MAGNKKIFDLPLRTGVTFEDRLAIVDSGDTTTYSVKVRELFADIPVAAAVTSLEGLTDDITFSGTNINISTNGQTIVLSGSTGGGGGSGVFIAADGTNNIVPDYYATSAIDSCSSESAIIGGTGNTIPNSTKYSVIVGSLNSTNNSERGGIYSSKSSTINVNTAGVVVGGESNVTGTGGYYQGVFAGQSNTAQGINSAIFAGTNNQTTGTADRSAIIAGQSNDISGDNSVIAGGSGNNITLHNNGILGGGSNTIGNIQSCNILGGTSNTIANASGDGSIIAGGNSNSISVNTRGRNNGIYNSYSSTINSPGGSSFYNSQLVIVGGSDNTISHDGTYPNMITLGGNLNSITDATNSAMVGGDGNTLSGHSRSVILGGSGLTSNYDEEVLVPNLTIANYSSLNFSGDTAAAAGGVVLGQVYHDNGALRIRIT